jgi:hypothetical protein
VAEHGDELVAELRVPALARQLRLARRQLLMQIQVQADQLGEQLEHADRLGRIHSRRPRIDRAERAEERPARPHDRHRDVALKAVHHRRRVMAERFVLGDVIDHDELPAAADLVADRGRDLQLAAWLQAELDIVAHGAGDPAVLGHARHSGETHPCRAAHDVEDHRHGVDPRDRGQIRVDVICHHLASPSRQGRTKTCPTRHAYGTRARQGAASAAISVAANATRPRDDRSQLHRQAARRRFKLYA